MAGVEGATREENKPVRLFLARERSERQAGSDLFAVRPTGSNLGSIP